MTLDQIKQAITEYKAALTRRGFVLAKQYTSEEIANHDGRYPHILWMCNEILNGNVEGEKAQRWFGFMQGVFFDDCQLTLGQLKGL